MPTQFQSFLFSVIFIVYTVMGGVYSVVWTDLFQGIICLVFGTVFYLFAFSKVDFSLAVLGSRLAEVGKGELWSFANVDLMGSVNKFLTGLIGVLVAQTYWRHAMPARMPKPPVTACCTAGLSVWL